jgi:acetyltransferase-like isoleucine patch superfamily enzyme
MEWPSRIEGTIEADEVIIGQGVVVEKGVVIRGKTGRMKRLVLGDFCYIGNDVKILCPEFSLGDYSKLNAYSFAHGTEPMHIGRNCWIGGNVVLDSIGGLDIDDNVGIGAQSQIWTHIQFGDIVEGSRFYSREYMHIGKDAWFVGSCLVSPVKIAPKSMALLGSVITHDMEENRIYGGTPAKDVTDKMGGGQFREHSLEDKMGILCRLIDNFYREHPQYRGMLRVVTRKEEIPWQPLECTVFNVANRTYTQTYSEAEVKFLKEHTPLIKFTPWAKPFFINPRI